MDNSPACLESRYPSTERGQLQGGPKKYGGITDPDELKANLRQHCIPEAIFDGMAEDYDAFLVERRRLMAEKIKTYFAVL